MMPDLIQISDITEIGAHVRPDIKSDICYDTLSDIILIPDISEIRSMGLDL
jgi:hypothetical protein